MFEAALTRIEIPHELSPDEMAAEIDQLNQQLSVAIDADDFDTAEQTQKKIDHLQAKLDKVRGH
jgi:protein-arginine kinase activator protein McsA